MPGECLLELTRAGKPHRERQCIAFDARRRQRLRLVVVAILQPVLQIAQEDIRGPQSGGGGFGQQAAGAERGERRERAALAQVRLAPAADELQGLHRELDLADAARPQLDVRLVVAALALLADLPMDVAQAFVGIEVEVLAIDERRDHVIELAMACPGQIPGLEPCVAFPGAALRDEVLLERGERRGQRPAVAIRAQAHVDAEHVTIGGAVVECRDDPPAQAVEEFAIGDSTRAGRLAVLGIGEDEVDVGRHVELAAPQLAHADDDQLLGRAVAPAGDAAGVGERRMVQ